MYNIRYVKLTFILRICNDCILPYFKNSAFRGGMGRMLMELVCTNNGECSSCIKKEQCDVQNIMYTKLHNKPDFLANDNSVGYIIECFDERTKFLKGDILNFNLILFGDSIEHLSHFIYAFDILGLKGLGNDKGKYKLISVVGENNREIFNDGYINKDNVYIREVCDYVNERKCELNICEIVKLEFKSPFRYKSEGHYKSNIDIQDLLTALNRRINILYGLEGIDNRCDVKSEKSFFIESDLYWKENKRYSSNQKQSMKLGGVQGKLILNIIDEDFFNLVIAGELIHIGKNTSFGLGKYSLY